MRACDSSNVDLPFVISARHDYCLNVYTCIIEVIVTINDGDEAKLISFANDGTPTLKDSGASAVGTYSLTDGGVYEVSKNNFEITFSLGDGSGNNVMVKFYYNGRVLKLESTDCLSGIICGLCGDLNDDSSDDFTRCDNLQVIDNTGASIVKPYDYVSDAWINTHKFGESCCNLELDQAYLASSDCGDGTTPDGPDTTCLEAGEDVCYDAWEQYCNFCDTTEATDSWLTSCAFDICANSACSDSTNLASMNVDTAEAEGCLDTIIESCEVNCPAPTIEPSQSPTSMYDNSEGCEDIDGGGWTLVRHVSASYGAFHPATDDLAGTDTYGTNDYNAQSDENWSEYFADETFNQFLFAFGDCSEWLVTTKDSAIGENYSKEDRCILSSNRNEDAYSAEWYNRGDSNAPDPWISTKDHWDCRDSGGYSDPCMVYAENSKSTSTYHEYGITTHGGGNVWIRYKDNDDRSCDTAVE